MSEFDLAKWIAENNPHAYQFAQQRIAGNSFNFDGPCSSKKIGCALNDPEFRNAWVKSYVDRGRAAAHKRLGNDILDRIAEHAGVPLILVKFIEETWLPFLTQNIEQAQYVYTSSHATYAMSRYPSRSAENEHDRIRANTVFSAANQHKYLRTRLDTLLGCDWKAKQDKPADDYAPTADYADFIRDVWWPHLQEYPNEKHGVLDQPNTTEYYPSRFPDRQAQERERELRKAAFGDNHDAARKFRNALFEELDENTKPTVNGLKATAVVIDELVNADLAQLETKVLTAGGITIADLTYTGRIWSREVLESVTNPKETNAMSTPITFTTTKFIQVGNGQKRDISQVSLDELFALIEQTEAEIARLEAIKKKPKALQARIDSLNAAIEELAAEADSR